jgi:hypothetical protein
MTTETENIVAAAIEDAEDICDSLDGLMDNQRQTPLRRSRPRCSLA